MEFSKNTSQKTISGKEISITTGVLARQANGAVVVQCGDMVLLATATMSKAPRSGIDFFPLTVEFSEKMYASGKIPGGFFKREARPSTDATLNARLIDRPLRPTFPKWFKHDVQVIITVLSYDPTVAMEPLSIIASSAAISISDLPFNGPIGSAIVGLIDGEYVINPNKEEQEKSDLNIVVAGTKEAILMVESESKEVSEETILKAIMLGHESVKETIELQEELVASSGKEKLAEPEQDPQIEVLTGKIKEIASNTIETALEKQNSKQDLDDVVSDLKEKVLDALVDPEEDNSSLVSSVFEKVKKEKIRRVIIDSKIRPDGRKLNEIRPIDIQVGVLPSAHGSSVFTRGETQSLGVVTLGGEMDSQIIDGLHESDRNPYFFHYNFPPFSVGEVGRLMTGRRELGHGALAQRALKAVLPTISEFPYTIRIVSEILESNGSSSMASVCSGSLSLMDCGVPVKAAVSGIAMGLLIDGSDYVVLSDIQGLEDHYGDMDFKVAGTEKGITALQLDIKVAGLSEDILKNALEQAKEGRLHILSEMNVSIQEPRSALSKNAPKIHSLKVDPEKVGMIIGPGGKMIRKIEEESGATVNVSDGSTGIVTIVAKNHIQNDLKTQLENTLVGDLTTSHSN